MSKLAKLFVPLVALGGLGGAAYYFSSHGGGLGGHNVVDLARNTPQKAFLWMAAEMREEASPAKLTEQIAKARKDYKGFNDFCVDFEKETGKKLDDVVKTYAASGYIAFYVAGGKDHIEAPVGSESPVDVVLDCQLYDPKAADEMLGKVKEKSTKETLAGQTVYVSSKDFCLSIAGDSLLLTNNKATMEKAITAATQHKGTLAEEEQFKKAVSKMPDLSRGNGSLMYLDLNPVWASVEKAPRVGQYTDTDTFKGLRSLPYAIGGGSGTEWQMERWRLPGCQCPAGDRPGQGILKETHSFPRAGRSGARNLGPFPGIRHLLHLRTAPGHRAPGTDGSYGPDHGFVTRRAGSLW
jgi:hypothetical protein